MSVSDERYLTSTVAGTGGVIKATVEDFLVEEIPSYLPGGEGEHCYLLIEKRGITTLEALRRLSRATGVAERDLGYAGMKDAIGVTRQTVSIPRVTPESALALAIPGITVLSAKRHGNKLRLGHLKGNRFQIRVRETVSGAAALAEETLALLQDCGVPNFFGAQRYGVQGNSHRIGACVLRRDFQGAVDALIGEPDAVTDERWRQGIEAYKNGDLSGSLAAFPGQFRVERELLTRLAARPDAFEKAFNSVPPRLKRLYLSAFQSLLFDRVLEKRLTTLGEVLSGDIAFKHENGACFAVTDESEAAPRAQAFEISPTGPMFGCTMMEPAGAQFELERAVLAEEELTPKSFDLPGGLKMEGERRALRVPLKDVEVKEEGGDLLIAFSLPRGSYATSVLREVQKND